MKEKDTVLLLSQRIEKFKKCSEDEIYMSEDLQKPYFNILAQIKEETDGNLRLIIEYLHAENKVLRKHLGKRISFDNHDRILLAEKGKALGRKLLKIYATVASPDTILKWFRNLIKKKFTYPHKKKKVGRPPLQPKIVNLIVKFARDNENWGYDRIAGALKNLGISVSDQTVANVLKKRGIYPAPERRKNSTWKEFIKRHLDVMFATDFFTVEALTPFGLKTFYVLFFIHYKTRKIILGGITKNPNEEWMKQIARNVSAYDGELKNAKFVFHDRDSKFTDSFDAVLRGAGIDPVRLPAKSPNLNAYAERWIRSCKEECLNHFIPFGRKSLEYILKEYIAHYNSERNHQGIDNNIPFPNEKIKQNKGSFDLEQDKEILKKERLGGLLNFYYRKSA